MKIELTITLAVFTVLVACKPYVAQPPQGFAAYEDSGDKAVSADGIMYRVRAVDNEPEADLAFWREAMKKRMTEAGYAVLSEGEVKASGRAGYLLELAAPLGTQDYVYLVALFHAGDELVLVESAGEASKFAARRQAVLDAVGGLTVQD